MTPHEKLEAICACLLSCGVRLLVADGKVHVRDGDQLIEPRERAKVFAYPRAHLLQILDTADRIASGEDTAPDFGSEVWAMAQADNYNGRAVWYPIGHAFYWDMLEALPPVAFDGLSFAVGETWNHTADGGQPLYLLVRGAGDHDQACGWARIGTRAQLKQAIADRNPSPSDKHRLVTIPGGEVFRGFGWEEKGGRAS